MSHDRGFSRSFRQFTDQRTGAGRVYANHAHGEVHRRIHRGPEGHVGVDRKDGFKNFAEYEAVAANISMVMAAIDPQTKEFTDSQAVIKKELENVSADKTIADNQKKQLLKELNAALKSAEPIQFSSNIELVKKYYDKIDVTMIAAYDGESRTDSRTVRTISE